MESIQMPGYVSDQFSDLEGLSGVTMQLGKLGFAKGMIHFIDRDGVVLAGDVNRCADMPEYTIVLKTQGWADLGPTMTIRMVENVWQVKRKDDDVIDFFESTKKLLGGMIHSITSSSKSATLRVIEQDAA